MPLRPMPALGLAILLLGGCDYQRPGTWHASGVNDANLRTMLAEPAHAVSGVAAQTERGQPASLAVYLLERDRRRPLPNTRAALIGALPTAPVPQAGPTNGR